MMRIPEVLAVGLLVGALAASPVAALDGIALSGPESVASPEAIEILEGVRSERASLEKRMTELAERQAELERAVVKAAETALTACPALTQIKYPFLECEPTPWGSMVLSPTANGGAALAAENPLPNWKKVSNWHGNWVNGPGYWGPRR